MKDSYLGHVKNPMTIIVLCVVIEFICGNTVPNVPDYLKPSIIAFMLLFPPFVIVMFFVVWIKFPQKLYGPQDYKDDKSYLESIASKGKSIQELVPSQNSIVKNEIVESESNVSETLATVEGTEDENPTWIDHMWNKDYKKATAILEEKLNNTQIESERIRTKTFINVVKLNEDRESGVKQFNTLIEEHPKAWFPYYWLALEYILHELPEMALKTVEKGIKEVDEPHNLIPLKAQCLEKMGRSEEAVKLLEDSLSKYPDDDELYTSIVRLLLRNKKDPEIWLRKGLRTFPANEELLASYASYLYEHNRKPEALYVYTRLTTLFPNSPTYFTMLGNVYLDLELSDKALQAYEKAKDLSPKPQAWIIANIGNLYTNRGFYHKALEHLNEALSLESEDNYTNSRIAATRELQREEQQKAEEIGKHGQQLFLENNTISINVEANTTAIDKMPTLES